MARATRWFRAPPYPWNPLNSITFAAYRPRAAKVARQLSREESADPGGSAVDFDHVGFCGASDLEAGRVIGVKAPTRFRIRFLCRGESDTPARQGQIDADIFHEVDAIGFGCGGWLQPQGIARPAEAPSTTESHGPNLGVFDQGRKELCLTARDPGQADPGGLGVEPPRPQRRWQAGDS